MFTVKAEYQKAGLEVDGSELPDHIAVELEFLSFLAKQESKKGEDQPRRWGKTRQMFIKNHAAQWMPAVGRQLASMHDPAWSCDWTAAGLGNHFVLKALLRTGIGRDFPS